MPKAAKARTSSPPPWLPTQIVTRSTAALRPDPRNARTHSKAQVAKLAGLIRTHGFLVPILVDEADQILAGHGRLQAAVLLKLEQVPCIVAAHLTAAQRRAYVLADNQIALLAGWDEDLLNAELAAVAGDGIDLVGLGFDGDRIARALKLSLEADAGDEDLDDVPEPRGPIASVAGEVYHLGPHRLLCGDSTVSANWHALLGREILDAVMTDPPYGVNYVGKTADALLIDNDNPEGLPELLDGALGCALERCRAGAAWYVAGPAGPLSLIFENWLHAKGIFRQAIIWVKDAMVLGHSDYHYKHEPIYYGWKPGAQHRAPPDRTQVSVWEIPRPKRSAEHPTMKPIRLYERMMNNSTVAGELIGEPFGGSGTTLIAAAKTGRVCRAMEIDPTYCDVIRRRWTAYAIERAMDPGEGALA